MDDLDELVRLAESGEAPPADLADRLWPQIRHTYRVGASSTAHRPATAADVEMAEVLPIFDGTEEHPARPSRRPLIAVAAAVAALVIAGIVVAIRAGDVDNTPADSIDPGPSAASLDELCRSISIGMDQASRANDLESLDELVAALRELRSRIVAGDIAGATPSTAAEIGRSASTFDQARRSFEIGDVVVALTAADQAVWEPEPDGPLRGCARS